MEAPKLIGTIASIVHKQILKPNGFRKKGMTASRQRTYPEILNFQSSKWNDSKSAEFTINLGIYIEEIHECSGAHPVGDNIKEYNCDMRERIGSLMPGGTDYWWEVREGSDPESIASEVIDALSSFGLPWFDKYQNLVNIASFYENKDPFMAAVTQVVLGNIKQAEEFAKLAYMKAHKLRKRPLRDWALKNGIALPNQ
ncbi:MAG: DUF4304 domain-containing protein [Candidatus Electrothrix scaldis]|nr:MAG: DUF4304 domain-containing protein [Candidatus Electrothrix sp. GW3-3]